MLDEGGDDLVDVLTGGQTFDGRHLFALALDREAGTGEDRLAIDDDGAGTAVGGVADMLGAGEAQVVAERVEQGDPRLDLQGVVGPVDVQLDLHRFRGDDGGRFVFGNGVFGGGCGGRRGNRGTGTPKKVAAIEAGTRSVARSRGTGRHGGGSFAGRRRGGGILSLEHQSILLG